MTDRRLIVLLGLLLLVAPLAPRRSPAAEADAAGFVADFANKVLDLVRAQSASPRELEQRLRPLALDAFDVSRIARFVLGRYWRGMSDAEREQFMQAFEDYIVHVYAARFTGYRGERFAVTGSRPENTTGTLVHSEVTRPGDAPPIKLDWQVDRLAGGYKIADVTIDGVSQAVTYREEFASVIERHGGRVSDLIAELRAKAGS